ncbi:dipeptidase 1 isoform X2 [Eurytemora carolleeae]|uniref:dipeptidase 1 isoform X2 n=1 Tax=Eurytemora carolleeae TaxID=1294199 RepID=UPI000C75E0D1|nr:dipeptidase 1 isoform X2 [Eurytemora carolleeae]|eukprot:XP_023321043.1 dipeptidase 1-like isoform X2 [Eurytemora affinis]
MVSMVVVLIVCLGIFLPISRSEAFNALSPAQQKKAVVELLTEVPLIDGHNDLAWNLRKFVHNKLEKVNLSTNIKYLEPWSVSKWSHTDLLRLREGRVGAQLWTAYAPCGSQHKDAVQITLEQIDLIKRMVEQYSSYLQLAQTAQEITDAHKSGRIASLLTVESGHSIGTSLAVLRMFQRLGVRVLTLTHNCDTPWADCSQADKPGAKPTHNGLTTFGQTVVKEMNRLGIIVDLSHSSIQTARDTLAVSEAPVIFSHSSAHALCNSTRNVPDDVLRIVAERRGLVMVNFFSYFLTCSNHSTLNDVISHINHIRRIAGIDSVGIGASYDGISAVPKGLEDVSTYPALFTALLASDSWSIDDLKKLAGLNFLRVLKTVEEVAAAGLQ